MNCNEINYQLHRFKNSVNTYCLDGTNYIDSDICFVYNKNGLNNHNNLIAKKQVLSCLSTENLNCGKILDNELAKKNLVFENNVRLVLLGGLFLFL